MLPISSVSGVWTPFLDAFFTATSATCVTGLVVYDTALYWSMFGQFVILSLIQVGGLGIITMAIAVSMFAGRRIGLKQRWVMQESISAPRVGGIVRLTGFIFRLTFLVEGVGALLLAFRFCPELGFWKGLWYSVFHSISAFCNAGFDLMGGQGPFSSLTGYAVDPLVNVVAMLLIITGGLGFLTWHDILEKRQNLRDYTLQSKIILTTTAFLLLLAVLFFFFYELQLPQWDYLNQGEKLLISLFQATTPRTAGFNTVDLLQVSGLGQLFIVVFMLIGGSPGSTAGGFKTTTLAVLMLSTLAVFRRKDHAQCFGRRISESALRSAVAIFFLYLILCLTGGMLIGGIEGVPMSVALFESASAIGTVGLSLGLTPSLSAASKVIVIFLMYFGRVGGLTLIYAMTSSGPPVPSLLPQEKVTVG